MALRSHKRAVGIFPNRRDAELALRELRDSHFPMDRVSAIARDSNRPDEIAGANVREKVGNKADEGATAGAVTGGALGGLTGLLVGLGTLAIPGIGPILLAGATATAIATTLAGGAIGAAAGGLIGALIGLGIPEERARVYNERVSRGEYLVIVEGTEEEIRRAEAILHRRGIQEWGVFDAPNTERSRTSPVTPGTPSPHVGRQEIYDTSGVTPGRVHHDSPDWQRDRTNYATAGTPRPALGRHHRAVGIFSHRRDAEAALHELRDAGFPMSQISLSARDYDGHNRIPGLTVRDRFDNTFFGFLGERNRFFHDRFNRGEYLVMVDGTDDEIRRAEAILRRRGIQEWGIYDSSQLTASREVIEPGRSTVVSSDPEVIIVDRREQTF